ncbi:hypothetical protein [Clostridium sp. DJ247]|uniref:hypothetical protein n=1 Tax=Clostridium sp. DJ247 TaxID=2726188 RepID=UPI00162AABE0|nr:hypothetical protein [Clostridium sp. DJ247]MBC2580996.1 hypothetical protein [Clostridium sp. DJ247]
MEYINRNFSTALRLILFVVAALIFVKVLPLLVVAILGIWIFNSGRKYFKKHKKEKNIYKQQVYKEKSSYNNNNFSNGKIIDVEYEEV